MDVIVSNASAQPIYEQIYSQIKAQILSGALREGELLLTLLETTEGADLP